MEEWVLDEIEFECGNGDRTFTRDEFKMLCASLQQYIDTSSFTMLPDTSSLKLKDQKKLDELRESVNAFMSAMWFHSSPQKMKEMMQRNVSPQFVLQFESTQEMRDHLLKAVGVAYRLGEASELPIKGWKRIVELMEAEPLKPRKL